VDEFDADLERRLAEAHREARARGRNDVADYLLLRASNDQLRTGAVAWLLDTVVQLAAEANRAGASISLERSDETHRFRVGNATMVGTRLALRVGVRSLTIEAGWPRTPRDGIVRGGGLACARTAHFGDRAAGEEFLLVPDEAAGPRWYVLEATGGRAELRAERLRRHVSKLLSEK
jgi:hypothetical protein